MRHRWACWAAVMVVVLGHRALAQAPPPAAVEERIPAAPLVFPLRLVQAALDPDLPDLALYLQIRAAAGMGDVERASAVATSLLERYGDSIWAGRARLDVARVRRRTGDLVGARQWLVAAADTLPDGDRAAAVVTLQRAELAH